jgi:hypothetical protein
MLLSRILTFVLEGILPGVHDVLAFFAFPATVTMSLERWFERISA